MLPEQKVLGALVSSREAWERVHEHITETDFTVQGRVILKAIEAYYKADATAERVDPDILLQDIDRNLGNAKKLESFKIVLAELPRDIGANKVTEHLLEQKREAAADTLANALAARSGTDSKDIERYLAEYQAIHEATDLASVQDFALYTNNVQDLFLNTLADERKIKILPKALNDMIGGGAYPGHCVVLFGRVEMGKSMFAIQAAVGFVAQGLKVLYIENEDNLSDTQRRFIQRLIRRDRAWIKANAAEAEAMAEKRHKELFMLTADPETAKEVERAIIQHEPDAIIINQVRNMGDGSVESLDRLAHQLRRIGKKHQKLMFLVTAAREGDPDKNGRVRDKIIMERADVYSSRTGIPAAADLLLGWGGSESMKANGQAALSITKNKLVDEGGHGAFYCTVEPGIGKIEGEG